MTAKTKLKKLVLSFLSDSRVDSIFNKYLYRVGDHKSTISAIFGVTLKQTSFKGRSNPIVWSINLLWGQGTVTCPY